MSESDANTHPNVVVVGWGVIGATTATLLQSRLPKSTRITVVAAELPTHSPMHISASRLPEGHIAASADYASMWAGAHYRPIPYLASASSSYQNLPAERRKFHDQLAREAEWARTTARHMREVAGEYPESGVRFLPAAEYLENPPQENLELRTSDVYAVEQDDFRVLDDGELTLLNERSSTGEIRWACTYTSYTVNVHLYCAWLLERFREAGGQVIRQRLASLEAAFALFPSNSTPQIVVNCSGRNFDHDPLTRMIRGQTVLVKNPYHQTITRQNRDGSWSFLIPRPNGGGTIVGGTKEISDPETQARPEQRKELLANAVKYFPDFVNTVEAFEVVCDNVGRRPWREGGARIEVEELRGGKKVVHGYGFGGRGFELSFGAAEEICRLTESCLPLQSRL